MAIYANLSIDQGSDFTEEITVRDNHDNIVNLSGYTAHSQMRRHHTSSTKYDFNVSIISESAGIVSMKLNSSVSNNIKPGRYQYDVELRETSTGNVTRIVEGQVEITAGITRRLTR
jgi:hypothetical protein